jgi:hypothetical protein
MTALGSSETASHLARPGQRGFPYFAVVASLLIIPLASVSQALAARLGGAYYVDDAEIGKLGSCEFESWSSFAANGDRIAVFSPACVVNFGTPIELGTNIVNLRSDGRGTRSLRSQLLCK